MFNLHENCSREHSLPYNQPPSRCALTAPQKITELSGEVKENKRQSVLATVSWVMRVAPLETWWGTEVWDIIHTHLLGLSYCLADFSFPGTNSCQHVGVLFLLPICVKQPWRVRRLVRLWTFGEDSIVILCWSVLTLFELKNGILSLILKGNNLGIKDKQLLLLLLLLLFPVFSSRLVLFTGVSP